MMMRDDELVDIVGASNEREPHQRRLRQVEPTAILRLQQRREPVLLLEGAELSPVVLDEGQNNMPMNGLHRFLPVLPMKGRSQHRVPCDHRAPRVEQRLGVERPRHAITDNDAVHPRL